MQTIAISIDTATLEAVDRLRRKRKPDRTSRSELIRRALQRYVAEQDRLEWEARERDYQEASQELNADALARAREQAEP